MIFLVWMYERWLVCVVDMYKEYNHGLFACWSFWKMSLISIVVDLRSRSHLSIGVKTVSEQLLDNAFVCSEGGLLQNVPH